jgi:hypothetical protein
MSASLEYIKNAGMCVALLIAYSSDADIHQKLSTLSKKAA